MPRLTTALVAAAVVSSLLAPTVNSQRSASQPRVEEGDLSEIYTFELAGDGFKYGGVPIAFNPARKSLFVNGWANAGYAVGEWTIPEAGAKGTEIQPLTDIWEGRRGEIGYKDNRVGGLLVVGDRLLSSIWAYYPAEGRQTRSHFSVPLDLSVRGQVTGPVEVGRDHPAGFYSGYMTHVPAEWQEALGGPLVTGGCCTPIISATSHGPALFGFDPAKMKTTKDLLWYDGSRALRPYGHGAKPEPLFNGTTRVTTAVIPAGTRTVLFFGETGTGPRTYGGGEEKADPIEGFVWAYDISDLSGRRPWTVQPYATWKMPFRVGSGAYDPDTRRLYLMQVRGEAGPLVHVMQIGPGTAEPAR